MITIKCTYCENEYSIYPSRILEKNFCSKKCANLNLRTNKERICIICNKKYYVSKSQVFYRNTKCCSNECRYKMQSKKFKLAYRKHKKQQKEDKILPRHIATRHLKNGREKSNRSMIKKLDKLFSVHIRKKYADENGFVSCITCGKRDLWTNVDAGHYVHRGWISLRWDERNVHPQCRKCNRFQGGNMDEYALALESRYGKGILEELKRLKVPTPFKRKDYLEIITKYGN